MLSRGLPLLVAAAAVVSAANHEDVAVTFLEFPPPFMTVDHKCRHGAGKGSIRLQVVPDISVTAGAVGLVQWKVLDLETAEPDWTGDPDICNVKPGSHRVKFKSTVADVAVTSNRQDVEVKPGTTTMLWLRVKNQTAITKKQWVYYFNEGLDAHPATPDMGNAAWQSAVKDFDMAVKIEEAAKKCDKKNGGCNAEASCTVSPAADVVCTCNMGYTGNGKTCEETKTCETLGMKCPQASVCKMISDEQASCFCKQGYSGFDNTTQPICHPINPCLEVVRGNCSKYAFCEMAGPAKAKCTCNYGYIGSGKKCTRMQSVIAKNESNSSKTLVVPHAPSPSDELLERTMMLTSHSN